MSEMKKAAVSNTRTKRLGVKGELIPAAGIGAEPEADWAAYANFERAPTGGHG
jgi:hypothetical protein